VAIIKENIFGVPDVGVYLALSNQYFLHPPKINSKLITFVKELNPAITPIRTFIGGGATIGAFVAMNSNGIIVPDIIRDEELRKIKDNMEKNFQIGVIKAEANAFGNLILCNDKGAIISSKIAPAKEAISDILKVPVKIFDFANSNLPGSCGKANNFGVVVHPMITEKEAEIVYEILKVDIDVSTINTGNPFIGGGCIANDKGAIFGRATTGPEIQRIMEILRLE
jgi:translation initiation factor 6